MADMGWDRYFTGSELYGDSFSAEEIIQWFSDEEEGHASLWATRRKQVGYEYHALNAIHCFQYLGAPRYSHVLSVGGATGDELYPLLPRIDCITILEPSSAYVDQDIQGIPVRYVRPHPSGIMPFREQEFDLITCFGCLHHVPNVTMVIREMVRCLIPGGTLLMREPIVSMGDWRAPRVGLTKHERGIPLGVFRSIINSTGAHIVRESLGGFPLTPRLRILLRKQPYNSYVAVSLDKMLSGGFAWNYRYHPVTAFQKLTPSLVSYVLQKPS
jgi:SAM-dependent methyltransferase